MAAKSDEVDVLLKKLGELLRAGRTAGRQKFRGGVLFWSLAQTRTREPLSRGS